MDYTDLIELKKISDTKYIILYKANKKYLGDFEVGDDGFWYWWPPNPMQGYMSDNVLLALAQAAKKLNKPVEELFNVHIIDNTLGCDSWEPSESSDY